MTRLGPIKMSNILKKFVTHEFGGKEKGPYIISRADLLKLSGRKTLPDAVLHEIQERLQERGYILIDLGDRFSVIEEPSDSRRKVTRKLVEEELKKIQSIAKTTKKGSKKAKKEFEDEE